VEVIVEGINCTLVSFCLLESMKSARFVLNEIYEVCDEFSTSKTCSVPGFDSL